MDKKIVVEERKSVFDQALDLALDRHVVNDKEYVKFGSGVDMQAIPNKVQLAVYIVRRYPLNFGLGVFGLTAYLPKSRWHRRLDTRLDEFSYGAPMKMSKKEKRRLKTIAGGAKTFEDAIIKCFVYACNAKVI